MLGKPAFWKRHGYKTEPHIFAVIIGIILMTMCIIAPFYFSYLFIKFFVILFTGGHL
jgi:hypothetical protein